MIKKILIGVIGLVIAVVALIVVAANVIDPNDYKDKIQAAAKQHGGVDLAIEGDLKLSYFPWIGLSTGALSVSQPESFDVGNLVAIDEADIKLKLLPLLSKEVIVSSVVLKGAALDLHRKASGEANWEEIGPRGSDQQSGDRDTSQSSGSDDRGEAPVITDINIGPILIENANIRYRDDMAATDATLSNVSVKTGAFTPGQPFSLSTDLTLSSQSAAIALDARSESTITADIKNKRYLIEGLSLNGEVTGEAMGPGPIGFEVAGDIVAAIAENKIDVSSLSLQALGVNLQGDVAVTALDSQPRVVTQLSSNTFSPAELMQKLGLPAIATSDEKVLKSAKLDLRLSATAQAASLEDIALRLDDSSFTGKMNLPNLAAAMPPVRFDFEVDKFDADRYLPAVDDAANDDQSASNAAASSTNDATIALPIQMLRDLDVEGQFAIADFRAMNLQVNDIAIPVNAKAGKITASKVAAALYSGKINTTATLDVRGLQPAYSMKFDLQGVQAEPLLQDLLQDSAPIAGAAIFKASITATGNSVSELKRGLNGKVNADFTDGAINGINIGYQMRRAGALFSGSAASAQEERVKTDFSALHLGAEIKNGVIHSDDLDMRAPALRLNGEGSVDLVQEMVDYIARPKVVGSAEGQGGADMQELKGLALNIPIRGSFTELSANFLSVMFDGLKNAYGDQAKQRAQALRDAEAEKLKARADAKKAEVKAKLQAEREAAEEKARLKLRQQQEKLDAKADELKNKARDKLKSFLK